MHKIKKLALSVCFVLMLGIILSMASFLFERKESANRYSEFWENPGEYDVWFIGNSHIYYSVQPMELWEQHGIRSYDLAAPGSYLPQTYWTLMCALEYSQPKMIVLDPFRVHFDTKHQKGKERVHIGFDEIPLSAIKMRGICDIFDTWKDRFEYINKFSIYHNRWEELEEDDFNFSPSITKGGFFKNKIVDKSGYQLSDGKDDFGTDTLGFAYLKKIIEECQERGIELLLVEMPFCCGDEEQSAMNAVAKLAEGYGLSFLDLQNEKLVDYGVDYGDSDHVNVFGAKKITQYMGDYLTKHYDLTDYRESPEVAEKWNGDYESYQQLWARRMCEVSEIKKYVQWLENDRYACYMYKEKEPEGLLAKEIAQLNNITYISKEEAEARMGGEIRGEYAFFVEDGSGASLDKAVFKDGKRQ